MSNSENLDRFVNRRQLHVGAVATVYVAWDTYRAKEVVLKVLRPEHVHDPAFMAIFRRELRVSMLLEHDYIVPVRDVALDGDKPYFAMPYYRAGSLRDRLDSFRASREFLPIEEAQRIFRCLGSALDEAHSKEFHADPGSPAGSPKTRGILHRDIKPSNVFVELDGSGKLKSALLADFGIAHAIGSASVTTSAVIGTPPYFSPEVGTSRLGPRSDLYSLGVMMYEVLCNQLPISPDKHHDVISWIRAHADMQPLSIRAFRPELPRSVQDFFLICLAKQPQDRFPNGAAMADAFDLALAGETSFVPNKLSGGSFVKSEPAPAAILEETIAPVSIPRGGIAVTSIPPKEEEPPYEMPIEVTPVPAAAESRNWVKIGLAAVLGISVLGTVGFGIKLALTPPVVAAAQTVDLSLRVQPGQRFQVSRVQKLYIEDVLVLETVEEGTYQVRTIGRTQDGISVTFDSILTTGRVSLVGTKPLENLSTEGSVTWPTGNNSKGWIAPLDTLSMSNVVLDREILSPRMLPWAPGLAWTTARPDEETEPGVAKLTFSGWPETGPSLIERSTIDEFTKDIVNLAKNSDLSKFGAIEPPPADGWTIDNMDAEVDLATGLPLLWRAGQTFSPNNTYSLKCKIDVTSRMEPL